MRIMWKNMQKIMTYSKPVWTVHLAFFTLKKNHRAFNIKFVRSAKFTLQVPGPLSFRDPDNLFVKNYIAYQTLADLRPYVIGVVRGVEFEQELTAAGLRVESANNVSLNIRKVLANRIDLGISAKSNVLYNLRQGYSRAEQGRIEFLAPPFREEKVYINFSKLKPGYQKLTDDFNTGLRAIKRDGTYQKIIQQHGISPN